MIAAIYARKSTDQNLPDAEKSVTRQVEHAMAYATRKGWIVEPAHVYVDNAVSGAEFGAKRSGFFALMNALKPRPPFGVLVTMEQSRLGRSVDEVPFAIKRITDAGVRIFEYLKDSEIKRESAADKFMIHAIAFVDDMHRQQSRERTRDALKRKMLAGHVAGGIVYGYRNVDVRGPDGKRSHAVRKIKPDHAVVIRRIFERIAAGHGFRRIAKTFNNERVPSPRAGSWAPTMIREMVHRPLYRGEIVWNKTGWIDRDGTKVKVDRPESEWLRRDAPELRIIPEDLWHAAHARLTATCRAYQTRSHRWGRPPDPGPHKGRYLLTGFTECAPCGASMVAWRRGQPESGAAAYRCSFNHHRGDRVCANRNTAPVTTVQTAVLTGLREQVLAPDLWWPAFRNVLAQAERDLRSTPDRRREWERQHETLTRQLGHATAGLARLGPVPAVVAKIQKLEAARVTLERQLTTGASQPVRVDMRAIERRLLRYVADWQKTLDGDLHNARELLRLLFTTRLRFTPRETGGYEITGPVSLGGLLALAVEGLPHGVVPPG